jgi:hypothetical protein
MDPYAGAAKEAPASGDRYIVFAANPGRLGEGEPKVAAWLAGLVAQDRFGADTRLHVRSHPNDGLWRERFGALASLPRVTVEPPGGGDLRQLARLLRGASVVVASAGSINLDAIALDTPTIGLAWEDESLPYWDRPARAYEFEHLAAVAGGPGFPLARTPEELEARIAEAIADCARGADARRALRERFIGVLDGRAAERVAAEIAAMAGRE